MTRNDAVDEENVVICCGICCANCGCYKDADCCGCSGKCGICCCNLEMCCKPATDPLCCCCCGPTCEGKGICNVQCQLCYLIVSGALPCNEEVPITVTILGWTLYPKCALCAKQGHLTSESMQRT